MNLHARRFLERSFYDLSTLNYAGRTPYYVSLKLTNMHTEAVFEIGRLLSAARPVAHTR